MRIQERSPTRVDLAGGTLDLWPLYAFVGGATTVNLAIDIWTECELERRQDSSIHVHFSDIGFERSFKNAEELLQDRDPSSHLLRILVKYFNPLVGFFLKTRSQSPVGGGLGGSSSLLISLLKGFYKLTSQSAPSLWSLVHLAHNLEAELLNTPTGTQDYVPAITGGVNIIHYRLDGVEVETLPVKGSALEQHFLLAYTGKSHHSGLNNFEVLMKAVNKNATTLAALSALKEVSEQVASLCRNQDWHGLPELFDLEIRYRLQLAPTFSSPEIEDLRQLTLRHGASAVKICGAGGGGCVLIWCSPDAQTKVKKECEKKGFQILSAKPVNPQ